MREGQLQFGYGIVQGMQSWEALDQSTEGIGYIGEHNPELCRKS